MIKVAIVSDTHAHLDERVSDIVKQCDYAIHAGDICGEEILAEMQPKTGTLLAVAGNNDPYCHQNPLPSVLSLDLPGGKLTVEHGHIHGMSQPCHDSLRRAHADSRVIVYGHTHKQLIDKSQQPWVINPGAAGNTRTHGGPSCLVLEADEDKWDVLAYRFSEK
jgi:putative phosphoesterase